MTQIKIKAYGVFIEKVHKGEKGKDISLKLGANPPFFSLGIFPDKEDAIRHARGYKPRAVVLPVKITAEYKNK